MPRPVRGGDACVISVCGDDSDNAIDRALHGAGPETAFYLAGPEASLWRMTARLRKAGVAEGRIQRQIVGSRARRVYCAHCAMTNDAVTTALHYCLGCGVLLYVRDHFSLPRGAYMGVSVDAETPGVFPETEVAYS